MTELLPFVEIEPSVVPTATLIGLHGLGADGNDLKSVFLSLATEDVVRIILPHAPVRPITVNGGAWMRGWYDIYGLDARVPEDKAGLTIAADWVGALIQREVARGIATDRIILAGYSQGGALALYTGLRYTKRLGGIVVLSGYLPLGKDLATEACWANKETPIFMAHGQADRIVPLSLFEYSQRCLSELGYIVDTCLYPIDHSISLEEIQDMTAWVKDCLSVR